MQVRGFVSSLLALSVLTSAGPGLSVPEALGKRRTPIEEVRALELQRHKATAAADVDALRALLADELTYTHSNGTVETKAQFLETIRSGRMKYQSMEASDTRVRVYGNVAVLHGKVKMSVVVDGQPMALEARFTDVWARKNGTWRMVSWQTTRVP